MYTLRFVTFFLTTAGIELEYLGRRNLGVQDSDISWHLNSPNCLMVLGLSLDLAFNLKNQNNFLKQKVVEYMKAAISRSLLPQWPVLLQTEYSGGEMQAEEYWELKFSSLKVAEAEKHCLVEFL